VRLPPHLGAFFGRGGRHCPPRLGDEVASRVAIKHRLELKS
jgi:hypothetical protein